MFVGESIRDIVDIPELSQDDLCHFVHRSLHTGTIIGRKSRQRSILDALKRSVKSRDRSLNIVDILE